jgi:hypothetical protein
MLEFLPPYSFRGVTIDGYEVPDIEAREVNEGIDCNIILDRRLGITIPAECAQQVIWLLANAHAIGAGYSCHGENSVYRPNPYKVRVSCIDTVTNAEGIERRVGDE